MSIDNTEVTDGFDDYEDDFSSDFDSSEKDSASQHDYSISEVDAVADLLMGGDGSGHQPKANDSGMRSRDIDRHGNVVHERNDPVQDEPSYAGNQSAPDMQSVQGRIDHYNTQGQSVQRQWEELHQMQGDLTPDQFSHQREFLQGQMAGIIMQQQRAQIEQMQNQQWLAGQEAQVREKHADIFNDPQKREVYGKKMVDYLGNIGYSRAEINEISAREYNAVLDHVKVTEERDLLKLENAKLKQERRNRNRSLKQGRSDIERGAGRSKKGGGDVYDEVARILGGQK